MVRGSVGRLVTRLFSSDTRYSSRAMRRKAGCGGQLSSVRLSPGMLTDRQTEVLEHRVLLDGDPYGGSGSGTGYGSGSGSGAGYYSGSTSSASGSGTASGSGSGTGYSGGSSSTGTTSGTMAGVFLTPGSSGILKPNGQQWFETFGTDPLSGVVSVQRDLPGGLALSYSSDTASLLPIVTTDTTWNIASLPTGPLTATLSINGVTQASVVIDQTGIQQGTPIRISLQATTPLASGKYDAQINISAPIGSSSQTQTLTQQVLVENRTASPFGKGWTINGLEKLTPQSGGALYINGAGVRVWFDSAGTAMAGAMASSSLVQQSDLSWRLNSPDGS